MTYAKPELVLLADARVAIQATDNNTDKAGGPRETIVHDSNPAYEADE
jgi:hypothetical protein